jgi:hypothetical protein
VPASRKRLFATIAAFVAAYGVVALESRLSFVVRQLMWKEYGDDAWLHASMLQLFRLVSGVAGASFHVTLGASVIIALLIAVARRFARARVLAGLHDPLEGARRFFVERRARIITTAPAIVWLASLAMWVRHMFRFVALDAQGTWLAVVGIAAPAALAFFAQTVLARRGLRALLAPTIDGDATAKVETNADGFEFEAVAVTLETRAAIVAMALFPFVFFGVMGAAGALRLVHGRGFDLAMMGSYVAITIAGAAAFARASRISVGVDGILVKGSSRRRFFAYGNVDGVRVRGTDIELARGKRTLLRLQLHGKDIARREALAARIEAAIARAHEEREAPVASFVASASSAELASVAAGGGGDYRRSAMSREELWSVVEGPASDSRTRRAAAEALAKSGDPSERARLRVAAENAAEPTLRATLEDLAEDEPEPARRALIR